MMCSKPNQILSKNFYTTLRAALSSSNTTFTERISSRQKRYQSNIQQRSTQQIDKNKFSYFSDIEGYVRTSPFNTVPVPDVSLDKYVWSDFHSWQDKTAAVCIVTGRQYTYAQLRDHCAALALRLQQKFKLLPGDVVAICLPNIPEYPIALLGTVEAGLVATTVNPQYTPEEIGRQLANSNSKFVICFVAAYKTLKQACAIAKKDIPIVCIRTSKADTVPEGAIDFNDLINPANCDFSELRDTNRLPNDMVVLPYSSGTTGLPKGVVLTHQNITSNCEMVQVRGPYPQLIHDTTETFQEVVPCLLPFFHIYGMTVCMISKLKLGCKLVTLPRFTPDDLIKSLYDFKGTVLNLVPPIVLFLTNSPKVEPKHLEHLRVVMSGAAPIGFLDVERMIAKYPQVQFVQGYGMTETSPVVMLGHTGLKKYSSVGFMAPNTEGKIASFDDENRRGLPPHKIGELCVRGPQVMPCYFNNEEATKDIFLDRNWIRTGDVGYYDEEGYFFITDRMKELIKVKGFQVPPAELEELLRDHPKISDAAVIGVPHDQYGEVPRAFVVLRPKQETTEKEIQDYIAGKVAVYKKLEGGVTFLDEIPKNVSGKILRRELKEKFC